MKNANVFIHSIKFHLIYVMMIFKEIKSIINLQFLDILTNGKYKHIYIYTYFVNKY